MKIFHYPIVMQNIPNFGSIVSMDLIHISIIHDSAYKLIHQEVALEKSPQ